MNAGDNICHDDVWVWVQGQVACDMSNARDTCKSRIRASFIGG